jgi:hypothetical protein
MTVVAVLSAGSVLAADWPSIYGPAGNSSSDQKGLLRTWPEAGPKVLWTALVGAGFGGPAVRDGKVYLLDRDEQVGDKLRGAGKLSRRTRTGSVPSRFPRPLTRAAADCSSAADTAPALR